MWSAQTPRKDGALDTAWPSSLSRYLCRPIDPTDPHLEYNLMDLSIPPPPGGRGSWVGLFPATSGFCAQRATDGNKKSAQRIRGRRAISTQQTHIKRRARTKQCRVNTQSPQ